MTVKSNYKYKRIKQELIGMIESGALKPHDRLYSQSDIIARYGTSVTTASRVLNELTFEGYAYRERGRGSFVAERQRMAKTLCLAVPFLVNEYSASYFGYPLTSSILLDHIRDECSVNGWRLQLYVDQKNPELRAEMLAHAIEGMDGIILCQALFPGIGEELDLLEKSGIPSVMLDTYLDKPGMNIISTDGYAGSFQATEMLHDSGFKRIIFFGRDKWNRGDGMQVRLDGYIAAMEKLGLEVEAVEHSNDLVLFEAEIGKIATRLFSEPAQPVAILSDHIAHLQGLCFSMMEKGIDPASLGLATFEGFPVQYSPEVPLIQIVQPLEEMARSSVRKIIAMSEGDREVRHELLPPRVVLSKTVSRGIRAAS